MAQTHPAETVYVLDDDAMVRSGLSRLLRTEGYRVECCATAEEFFRARGDGTTGCLILDLEMPGMDGFEVQDRLGAASGTCQVIFLTGHGTIQKSVRAIKSGAADFLTKPVDATMLFEAVRTALDRNCELRMENRNRAAFQQRLDSLTPREREVLQHVASGRLNKQIAGDLGVALKTVKVHRGRMMSKMGVRRVADLVRALTLYA
ncbi:response regulator transcription factor [Rhodobacterales bacterium]|nr:response regulator transcription factor [Rhodobacterales bacterium]